MQKHLHGWENHLLAKVGKEILIKTVAQVLLTYDMSVFLLSLNLCQKWKVWWVNIGDRVSLIKRIVWDGWVGINCINQDDRGFRFQVLT